MCFSKMFVIVIVFMIFSELGFAQSNEIKQDRRFTPLQIGVCNPIQLFPDTWDVKGISLNLFYSKNHDVGIINLGIVNDVKGKLSGIQLGLIANSCSSDSIGIQAGLIVNISEGDFTGVQISGDVNFAFGGIFRGVQIAPLNLNWLGPVDIHGAQLGFGNTCGNLLGLQLGVSNDTLSDVDGVQLGLLNMANGSVTGLQFGLINVCGSLNGWQIGALNFCRKDGLPFMPIVNICY